MQTKLQISISVREQLGAAWEWEQDQQPTPGGGAQGVQGWALKDLGSSQPWNSIPMSGLWVSAQGQGCGFLRRSGSAGHSLLG